MNKTILFSLLLSSATMVTACQHRPVAYSYETIDADGWDKTDTLRYLIDSLENGGRYKLTIGIRTSVSDPYPYRSLWMLVKQRWQNSERLVVDTVECSLIDEKGDTNGKGVSIFETVLPCHALELPRGACGEITVNHLMQREVLPGILSVGVKLEREIEEAR